MRAVLTAIGLLLGLTVLGAAPAVAYPSNNPDGAVLDNTVVPGEDIIFLADCFAPGSSVLVLVDGPGDVRVSVNGGTERTNRGRGTADADGAIRAVIETESTGNYTVTATGDRTCATGAAEANFSVVSTTAGAGLPRTGADGVTSQLLLGAGLVALGGLGVAAAWRRRDGSGAVPA